MDVGIDTFGAITGILLIAIIIKIFLFEKIRAIKQDSSLLNYPVLQYQDYKSFSEPKAYPISSHLVSSSSRIEAFVEEVL